jgi:transcription termination factor NusB
MVIANTTKSHFKKILSAVLAGKADLRVVIDAALEQRKLHRVAAAAYAILISALVRSFV